MNDEEVFRLDIGCPFSDTNPDMGGWFFGFYDAVDDGSYYILKSCTITPIAE